MNAYHESRFYRTELPVQATRVRNNHFLAHWHEDPELVYILDGRIRLGANQESRVLSRGDLAIFSSNVIHYYENEGKESDIIFLIFRPSLTGSRTLWPEAGGFLRPFYTYAELEGLDRGLSGRIKEKFQIVLEEMKQPRTASRLMVQGQLLELTALLYRYLPQREAVPGAGPREAGHVQRALQYLEGRFDQQVSLESMAGRLGLSPCYLSRLFHRYTGTGYRGYLNRLRAEKAEARLLEGDEPVTSVLYGCGFNSVRTFNRVYLHVKGKTPSSTRRSRAKEAQAVQISAEARELSGSKK